MRGVPVRGAWYEVCGVCVCGVYRCLWLVRLCSMCSCSVYGECVVVCVIYIIRYVRGVCEGCVGGVCAGCV